MVVTAKRKKAILAGNKRSLGQLDKVSGAKRKKGGKR
ncbi:MAG: hypothetical protein A4E48_00075 [Methanosaeta sp. PtaU1.Bin060]|nr:MAG: hypothetical protein A4E45_02079 [Methanosaeta sp. PtaB.Bin039]OPY55386.1 MAG: hypothetical protein A4E48_00075 [Methanosaeta sp. PtaU1.Bin060]